MKWPFISAEKKFDKIYEEEIQSRAENIARETLGKIWDEHDTSGSNMISRNLYERKKKKRKTVTEYVTERKGRPVVRKDGTHIIRSPYRHDRIDAFYNRESYFSRSINRQTESMMRNGFRFVSDNKKFLKLVNAEFTEMQLHNHVPLDRTIARMAELLKMHGIFFVEKSYKRSAETTDPSYKHLNSLRIIPPHKVTVYRNKNGDILGIDHNMFSFVNIFRRPRIIAGPQITAANLAIGYMYDAGDEFFSRPPCYSTFDDILTLRSIEETIELLCVQYGSPLLHVKVGNDENEASNAEVAQVHNAIVGMAENGMITTHHRVDMKVLNIQAGVADLMPYIEHFKSRVLSGVGSSPISVGESDNANRNTAESIDDALSDHCKYIANGITNVFDYNILPDILYNHGIPMDEIIDENGDPVIGMEFNEMKLEKQIMRENHYINQWNAHAITFSELRRLLQKRPLPDSEKKDLRYQMIDIPSKNTGQDGEAAAAASRSQPSNQHGTKPGPGSKKN